MEETHRADQDQEEEQAHAAELLGANKPTEEEQAELDAALALIAKGESPVWRREFQHPIHGPLEVVCKLPTAGDLTRHTLAMDDFAGDAGVVRSGSSAIYLAAITAFDVLFDRIVLDEKRSEDPEDPDHVKMIKVYYDAKNDISEHFPLDAWLAFSKFRGRLLDGLSGLKNSSAGTIGSESAESLPAPTASPSTTPA